MIMKFSAAVLAAQLALTAAADITFGKWYEALADDVGTTCVGWRDFYMGANIAIPVVVTDEYGKNVELSPGDVTVSPGTYIDFGDPYIMSEEGMWYTYGCPIFDVRVSGDRIDLEKDGGVWVYNNWEWEDIVGVTYELEKGIWPFFDDKNSGYSDAENWIKAHSDRQWIIIPTGTRPQKGTHTFTVKVNAGGSTASYPVSFKMSPDQKAKAATVRFNANGGTVDEYGRVVNLNSAVGELPVPDERTGYSFSGWWTDKTKGTRISASTKVTKAMTVYARWTAKKYKVTVEGGSKSVGTVSGAGLKAYGSKVTLKATPNKGYVFVGWENVDDDSPWPSALKSRQPSASFTMGAEPVSVRAVFAKTTADAAPLLFVDPAEIWYVEDDPDREIFVEVESLSYPSVTLSGAPSGIGIVRVAGTDNCYLLKVTNWTKLAHGAVKTVKLTAKNRAGKSAAKSIRMVLPNRTQAVNNGVLALNTSSTEPYRLKAGMKFSWGDLGIYLKADGWTISSVTGLPGLAWDAKKQKMTGVPSAGGTYAATFTVKKGKTSYVATATFVIEALPAGVVGTFYGYCSPPNWYGEFADNTSYALWRNSRKVAVTVASSGKVTAKIGSVSLAGTGLTLDDDGNYRIYIHSAKKYSGYQYVNMIEATINPNSEYTQDALTGSFGYGAVTPMTGALNEEKIFARKNAAATSADAADIAAEYAKLGKQSFFVLKAQPDSGCAYELACPNCVYIESGMKKTAFVKIEEGGKVTLSGSIAGTKVSGTTYLSYEYDQYDGEDLEVVARFFVGKFVIEIRGDTEYFLSNGSLWGRVWKK